MPELRLRGGALDGLRLHYIEEGQGPVTVLIHGLGGFAESWRRTVPALAPFGTVIALDLPGFGQSAKPRVDYRLSFLAQAVEGMMSALGLERVRLVGHSLGGAVAVTVALMSPRRVERLALIGASVPGFPIRPSIVYRLMSLPVLGDLAAWVVTPSLCASALARCMVQSDPDEVAFLVQHGFLPRTSPDGRAAYLSALRSIRADFVEHGDAYRAGLGALGRQTLVIHGRQDPVVPFAHAEEIVKGVPGAHPQWLDRCGHFPQFEHAESVNARLREFLYAEAASR
jgi:pimeloyl-ACP methyl ester carboxylesterase